VITPIAAKKSIFVKLEFILILYHKFEIVFLLK
jgi:hypothetical protein